MSFKGGGRLQKTFFSDADYATYLQLLAASRGEAGADIWAYYLMPNHVHHVHHVIVPSRKDSLARLFSGAHRRYTRHVNFRQDWRGHL
jgi:putative transposase